MKKLLVTLLIILTLSLAHTAYATNFGDLVIRSTTLGTYGAGSYFVAPLTGTIQSITFYNSGGGNVKAAILTGTGAGGFSSVVAQSAEVTNVASAGWVTIPITASVTAGTGYWLAAQTSGASNIYYTNTGDTAKYMSYNNPSVYGAWGTGCGSGCLNGYTISIYATYSRGDTFGINDGLIGHWSFDTKDTQWNMSTIVDTSGAFNDGALTNMNQTTAQRIGKMGQAYKFDGVDDYVLVNLENLSGGTDATFSAWVKKTVNLPPVDTKSGLVDLGSPGTSGATHYPYTDGKLYFGIFNNDNTRPISAYDDTAFDKTQWHHIVITQTPGVGGYKFYRNGVLVTSGTGLSRVTFQNGDALGRSFRGSTAYYFDGLMDDVRIYNRALSSNEVQQLYRQGLATYK